MMNQILIWLNNIVIFVMAPGSIILGVGYLIKLYIEFRLKQNINAYQLQLDKSLEQHKIELEKDFEKYKAFLQIEAYKSNYKFELLHIERANVIKNLFVKLVKVMNEYSIILQPLNEMQRRINNIDEKIKIADTDCRDLQDYFSNNELFLPKDIALSVNKVISDLIVSWVYFAENKYKSDYSHESFKLYDNALQNFKFYLEDDFRKMLGIER